MKEEENSKKTELKSESSQLEEGGTKKLKILKQFVYFTRLLEVFLLNSFFH